MTTSLPTLYVIYNADGTVRGKLAYAYNKLLGKPEAGCAACDLTHGGLSLTETGAWKELKIKLERGDVAGQATKCRVAQLHRDELHNDVRFEPGPHAKPGLR
jgi:hypothetical protein